MYISKKDYESLLHAYKHIVKCVQYRPAEFPLLRLGVRQVGQLIVLSTVRVNRLRVVGWSSPVELKSTVDCGRIMEAVHGAGKSSAMGESETDPHNDQKRSDSLGRDEAISSAFICQFRESAHR